MAATAGATLAGALRPYPLAYSGRPAGVVGLVGGLLLWTGLAPIRLRLWQPCAGAPPATAGSPWRGRAWPAGANGSPASDLARLRERGAWLYRRWRYAPVGGAATTHPAPAEMTAAPGLPRLGSRPLEETPASPCGKKGATGSLCYQTTAITQSSCPVLFLPGCPGDPLPADCAARGICWHRRSARGPA